MDTVNYPQNTHVLKPSEEKRMDDLFNNFARSEPNMMKFSEFFLFALDRSLVTPRIGFSHLYELVLDCLGINTEFEQFKDKPFNMQKERCLSKSQFNFLLIQLSKWIYHTEPNHLEKLLLDILSEKTVATKDAIQVNRTPVIDETTKRILTEQGISAICQFEEELRSCFVAYMSENYKKGKLLLKWEELALDNKKLTTYAFMKFLNDSQIVPHSMSPELISDILVKMVPAVVPREQEFYQKHKVVHIFDKDIEKNREVEYEGDPKLHFHEFLMAIMRVAFEHYPKSEEKKDMEDIIFRFMKNVLGFRANEEIGVEDFPNINKKIYEKLNNYYQDLEDEENFYNQEEDKNLEDVEDAKEPLELLADLQNEQIFNAQPLPIEIPDMIAIIKKDLPPVPEIPSHLQENPAPYNPDKHDPKKKEKVVIGDKLPDPPADKNKQQKPKPPKKKQLKKGEKPPKPIIYAGFPPPDPQLQYNYLEKLNNKLVYGEKNLSEIERGVMSRIEVIPVIIEEILYPPECLQDVRYLVESAINSYNDSNFIFALKCFDEAQVLWQKQLGKEIGDNILLFFEFSKASLYASAGRDDYALYWYFQCKPLSDKLPYANPDRALAYCGLGSVFYNTEEYTLALRSFLKAREIREKLHGVEHVDTATTYNNLGSCMFMLERNQEAHAYFKIAHAIFETNLGPYHNRTMTAARNIKKCEKGFFENIPKFKTLWETYENDPFKKVKKKKKKKK